MSTNVIHSALLGSVYHRRCLLLLLVKRSAVRAPQRGIRSIFISSGVASLFVFVLVVVADWDLPGKLRSATVDYQRDTQ